MRTSRLLLVVTTAACTAIGLTLPATAGGVTPHRGRAGSTTSGHTAQTLDGPSDLREYLPGTIGPGTGRHPATPATGPTLTVSATGVRDTYTLTAAAYGAVSSSAGGTVQAFFYVRTDGSSTWNIANGTEVDVSSGSQALWRMADQMGSAGQNYQWQMQACQSGSCSALTSIADFQIDPQVAAGNRAYYDYFSQQLSKAMSLQVNYATGNLVVTSSDLHVVGINGLDLALSHTYNSLTDSGIGTADFGQQWTNSYADMTAGVQPSGDFWFVGPTGYLASFIKTGSSSYTAPSGLDADLSVSGSTYTVTFHHAKDGFRAGDQLVFNGSNLTSIKDKHGNAVSLTYTSGQLSSITDTQGRTVSFANDTTGGQVQTVIDNAGHRTLSYGYDAFSNLTSYADAGVAASIAGDAATGYSYNGSHQLSKIVDPAGNITKIAYTATVGQVASVTFGYGTPAQSTTLFNYYPVGDSHCSSQSSYSCTTVEQDRTNAMPNPAGGSYEKPTYYFDKSGRVRYVYDPAGHKQSKSWDVNSNVIGISDKMATPDVNTVSYDGAGNNNPTQVQDPTGMTGTLGYTGSGHPYQPDTANLPNSASSPTSTQVGYSYAAAGSSTSYGDVTQVTQGTASLQATYQGDGTTSCGAKPGQLCSETNGKGGQTTFGYDGSGNLTSVTPPTPLGGISYSPDGLGRDVTVQDGNGAVIDLSYDKLDRVTVERCGDYNCTINYSYDGDGNTIGETVSLPGQSTMSYTFSYDPLNRLSDKTLPANGTAITDDAYSYDLLGNLTGLTESGSGVSLSVNYTFDNTNLLTGLTANTSAPNGTTAETVGFVNDNNGRRTETDFGPSGGTVQQAITYDKAGREVAVTAKQGSTTLTSYTYCYVNPTTDCPTTPDGSPLAGGVETRLKQQVIESDPAATSTIGYSYDALSRLTDANTTTGGTDHWSYGYDVDGNRTSQTVNGTSNSYTYNVADQATSTGYGYDAAGNATSTPRLSSLTVDQLNQTQSVTNSGTTTAFDYANPGQDVRTSAGDVDAEVSALGTDAEYRSRNGDAFYVRDPAGNLITVNNAVSGGVRDALTDAIGSVVALAQYGSGALTDRYSYEPYGRTTHTTGGSFNPWQYAGGYRDATGLYHFGARYYDPSDGRFTQQDPAGQGRNLYLYDGDSPLNYTDPSGLWSLNLSGCFLYICGQVDIGTTSGGDLTGGGGIGVGTGDDGTGESLGASLGSSDLESGAYLDASCSYGYSTVGVDYSAESGATSPYMSASTLSPGECSAYAGYNF